MRRVDERGGSRNLRGGVRPPRITDSCVLTVHRMADTYLHHNSFWEHGVGREEIEELTFGLPRLQDHIHITGASWHTVEDEVIGGPNHIDALPVQPLLQSPRNFEERPLIVDSMLWTLESEGFLNQFGHEVMDTEPIHGTPVLLFTYTEEYVTRHYNQSEDYSVIGMGPIQERWEIMKGVQNRGKMQGIIFGKLLQHSKRMKRTFAGPLPRALFKQEAPLATIQRMICQRAVWGRGYRIHQAVARREGTSWTARMRTGPGLRLLCSVFFCHHTDPENCQNEGHPNSSCNQCKQIFQISEAGFVETATYIRHTRADLRDRVLEKIRPAVSHAFVKSHAVWIEDHLKHCNHLDHRGKVIPYRGGWILGENGFPSHRIKTCYIMHAVQVERVDAVLLQHARCLVAGEVGLLQELLLSDAVYLPGVEHEEEDQLISQ